MRMSLWAWKRVADGDICQTATAASVDELFEQAGFGAVRINEPIGGEPMLAVRVERSADGALIEKATAESAQR